MSARLHAIEGGLGGPGEGLGGPEKVATDDRANAEAALKGDERAFADLVRRHSGGLHRMVARIICDDAEAWDVVQMAFLKAWQRLDRYNPRWSFATWLYRIGTNIAIDLIRSRGSRERAHVAGTEHRLRVVSPRDEAGDLSQLREVDTILGELVELLSPQQRAAFVMREVEGMETSEVAQALGCSPATIRNHVFQARKVLRVKIRERYPEYLPATERGRDAV
jgi:RNA polymerase sigma-70 factor (ECF subfamily)